MIDKPIYDPNFSSFILPTDNKVTESFSVSHYKNTNPDDFDKFRESMQFKIPTFQIGGTVNPVPSIQPVPSNVIDPSFSMKPDFPKPYEWKPDESVYDMSRFKESISIPNKAFSNLTCDDHKSEANEIVPADRFCSKCNLVICNNCVIENHSDHLKEAKNRIPNFLKEHEKQCNELRGQVDLCISLARSNDLKGQELMQENSINIIFNTRMNLLRGIRDQLENLMSEENKLRLAAINNLKSKVNNDLVSKITNRIYEVEDCKFTFLCLVQNQITKFTREWETLSDLDKIGAIKSNVLNKISSSFQESSNNIKDLINRSESNHKVLEGRYQAFEHKISFQDKIARIENSLTEILGKIKECGEIVAKGIDDFDFKAGYVSVTSSLPQSDKKQQQSDNPFIKFNPEYDLIVALKQKTGDLTVFNSKTKQIKSMTVNTNNFIDTSSTFKTFPDNSRYVNLGTSVLITGGYKDRQSSPLCYLMLFSMNSTNEVEMNIMKYPNMIEARERHNIIYLKDKESVVVCSGFFNQNAEITNMNTQEWKSLPKLNEVRANAALAYVNHRFIYCFSGFKINEAKVGQYLNSVDILDLDNPSRGWKFFNFEDLKINLKLCAMGVMNIDNSSIILCGGYDGSKYTNDVYRVDVNEYEVKKVEKTESTLPGNYIFIHNAFMRHGNLSYNYDLQLNLINYDPLLPNNKFKVILFIKFFKELQELKVK